MREDELNRVQTSTSTTAHRWPALRSHSCCSI